MDRYRLEYEIKKHNYTQAEFCNKIGVSVSAFNRKLNGKTEFTLAEIKTILDVLELKSPMGIFFADDLS